MKMQPPAGVSGVSTRVFMPSTTKSIEDIVAKYPKTPLEYMLDVMCDENAPINRRDRMALAAASFVHPRYLTTPVGKKASAQMDAENAGRGSEWGEDLAFSQETGHAD